MSFLNEKFPSILIDFCAISNLLMSFLLRIVITKAQSFGSTCIVKSNPTNLVKINVIELGQLLFNSCELKCDGNCTVAVCGHLVR